MRRAVLLSSLLLVAPGAVFAAPRTFQELANTIVGLMNSGVAVLIVLGIVVYFYGVSTNILKMKDEGGEKIKAYFFWGIIVLFVMVSLWGILQILQNTLFGGGQGQYNSGGGPAQVQNNGSFTYPVQF